jgi:hypothetical protein
VAVVAFLIVGAIGWLYGGDLGGCAIDLIAASIVMFKTKGTKR